MLRFASCLVLSALCAGQVTSPVPDYRNPQLPIDQRVADLLKRMTLEEKVAQTHSRWEAKAAILDNHGNFSPAHAKGFLGYGIGEITRPGEGKRPRGTAILTNAIQKWVLENTRLGIPVMFNEEGLHGYMAPGGTNFPSAIGLAGTWDTALVERVFSVVALEMRSRGAQHALGPVLDLARDPRWGRTEETYGEDPYLVSRIGVACIHGLQGGSGTAIDTRHVVATAKHFAVHGQPENGTNAGPGNYSERVIREEFLAPFQAAVTEGGVQTVLPSYNEIDGIPAHVNKWLLSQVLRREWGFQGYTVSDYQALADLDRLHHVVSNQRDAAKRALEAGLDQELSDPVAYATLAQQVREGRIDEAVLDQAVARILRVKFLAGLFDHPYVDPEEAERVTNSPEHRELAAQAARETITLLKNDGGLLPLDRTKLKTIAVIGPNAARAHLGGYSDDPGRTVSILEGIRKKAGAGATVLYAEGCKITRNGGNWWADEAELNDPADDAKLIQEAVQAARSAQVAVVVVGGNESTSREAWSPTHLGDRDSLELVGRQNDLVKAVAATGTPTVVFLINGRPLSIVWIAGHVPAILEGWYLGEETGTAAADVLFGDYNPAGRLPITIPRSAGQLPMFYNYKPSARRGYLLSTTEPLFPFGHGLSYTTFEYRNLKVAPEKIPAAGKAAVSVDVTNTGGRAGDEVVQLYIHDLVSSVTRPVKELKDFQRISLQPGETRTVRFEITPDKLSFLNEEMKRVVEPGAFDVMVGPSSARYETVRLEVE
jgi:beta-glucosidase